MCMQDNWPTVEPYFNETGSNCPSVLPRSTQEELCGLAVRSVQVGSNCSAPAKPAKQTDVGLDGAQPLMYTLPCISAVLS
jgi:hypothetical protein